MYNTTTIHTDLAKKKLWLSAAVFTLLFALLFQYRILSLLKKLGSNITPIGTKFPIAFDFSSAPQWLLPIYYTLDYLNIVWFTTLLGLFIAGAIVTLLPGFIQSYLKGKGPAQHFAGMLLGLPNMFCTCCAASAVTGLRRSGASLGPSLAFFVTAPALNIVVLILAFDLLPLKLAFARLLLGLIAAVGVTYALAKSAPEKTEFISDGLPAAQINESLWEIIKDWMKNTWYISKIVIPILVFGLVIIGIFKTALPFEVIAKHFGNNLLSTILASVVGTMLMVPTFTEVLWVAEFTQKGMGIGPAVALLITLPAVSLPSLLVLGKVLKSYRVAVYLGISILALGVIGGIVFSLI